MKNEEFSVRGTWEVNVAKHLNDLGIYWTTWLKAKPIFEEKGYLDLATDCFCANVRK